MQQEQYNNKYTELVNKQSIIECLEYVADKVSNDDLDAMMAFLESMKGLSVQVKFSENLKYKDDMNRNGYIIKVSRNDKVIRFNYWVSKVDTWEHKMPSLYDILACIGLDGTIDDPTDLGFDEIEDKKKIQQIKKHTEKILTLFDVSELYSFPN